ncbi:MAG: metal ABC transporter permease [Candidatus Krumholzibacteriota bacterium]|nr:metal ABC transporter permease [Candidatus Krumholzibacteriota bacterium]
MLESLKFLSIQIVLLFVVTSVHTYLGLHVIRRGIVFSDLSLDQLAALGVILGIGWGIQGGSMGSYLVSFVAVLAGSFLLAFVKPKNAQIPHEAVIGIIYGLALVASIMVADKISGGLAYVTQTLAGVMLWVSWPLVLVTTAVYALLSLFHFKYRERFISITEGRNESPRENFWDLLFFISLGIITVLIVPIAGVLLAYGFLMIPAAIATLFTREWGKALRIGWMIGYVASLAGLFSSYSFDLPYGPTLVITLGIFFLGALALRVHLNGRAREIIEKDGN